MCSHDGQPDTELPVHNSWSNMSCYKWFTEFITSKQRTLPLLGSPIHKKKDQNQKAEGYLLLNGKLDSGINLINLSIYLRKAKSISTLALIY